MQVCADATLAAAATFGPDGADLRRALRERAKARPRLLLLLLAPFLGPHRLPDGVFTARSLNALIGRSSPVRAGSGGAQRRMRVG